jgi:hypothetical protein
MKKSILKLTVTGLIAISSLNSYGQQNKKAEKERKNVAEAQQDLMEAKADSAASLKNFNEKSELEIAENQKKINALKTKKISHDKETDATYDKKVLALEKQNSELKKRISSSGKTKTNAWYSFKEDFKRDMDKLVENIKDIEFKNTK